MMNPVRPGEAVADLLDPERLFAAEPIDTEEGPPEQGERTEATVSGTSRPRLGDHAGSSEHDSSTAPAAGETDGRRSTISQPRGTRARLRWASQSA